jgi:hypothetical protein
MLQCSWRKRSIIIGVIFLFFNLLPDTVRAFAKDQTAVGAATRGRADCGLWGPNPGLRIAVTQRRSGQQRDRAAISLT